MAIRMGLYLYRFKNNIFVKLFRCRNEYLENNNGKLQWSKTKTSNNGWRLIRNHTSSAQDILNTQFTKVVDTSEIATFNVPQIILQILYILARKNVLYQDLKLKIW